MKLSISEILRKKRRELDMTQEQLAERLGVAVQSVSRWETGATYPDIEFLPQLAGIFSCTTDDLLGVSRFSKDKRQKEYKAELKKLTDRKERIKLLKKEHAEFPDDWQVAIDLCNEMVYEQDYVDELRNLVIEAMAKSNNPYVNSCIMGSYIRSKDTDMRVFDLIDKYYSLYESGHAERILLRYSTTKNYLKGNILLQKLQTEKLHKALTSTLRSFGSSEDDPKKTLKQETAYLELVNALRYEDKSQVKSLISGDGKPDMWIKVREECGLRISSALAATGKIEESLQALEETVDLICNFMSLAEGSILTYGPIYNHLDAKFGRYSIRNIGEGNEKIDCMHWGEFNYIENWLPNEFEKDGRQYQAYMSVHHTSYKLYRILTEDLGWVWLDPIRNEPRFKACVERLRKLTFEEN